MSLDIQFKFPDWVSEVKSREGELNLFMAAQIQANRGMLFDQQGARNNHDAWKTLKFRNGQILSNRGALRKSISPFNPKGTPGPSGIVRFTEDMIVVGTSLLYARMMNDGTTHMPGGVLRPKKAKALKIPLPSGQNATQTAKDIRAKPFTNRLGDMRESLARTQERASRAHARFTKSGSDKALVSAVNAERSVINQREKLMKMEIKSLRTRVYGKGGQGFIFVQSVKIPARPFDEWNVSDQMEMDNALKTKLAEILNG